MHAPGPAAQVFDDVFRLDQGFTHRARTVTGSTRVTTTIAENADATLIPTVSANRPAINSGGMIIGSAVSVLARATMRLIEAAMAKPITALMSACQRITL